MKQINLEEKKLLQEYFNCGTMKSDELESIVKEMKKEKVLQKHPYQITPPIKEGGRWMTYILDTEVNKRVKITSYTEDGIYQKLYKIYFPVKKETLEILYPLWIEKRKGMNLSSRTIQRNRNHWEKYYEGTKIVRKSIDRIMDRKKIPIEDIRWYLGHNDIVTTRTYIMNNQGKQKTSRQIVNSLSEMNGSDVLMGTQNSRNEKSPEAL